MDRYVLKQFDVEPPFEVQLFDGEEPVNLTSAVSASFVMRNRAGVKVNAAMSILDQTLYPGVARYRWHKYDTDMAGTYQAEIQVVWPPDRAQTFPSNSYLTVQIIKDLDRAGAA